VVELPPTRPQGKRKRIYIYIYIYIYKIGPSGWHAGYGVVRLPPKANELFKICLEGWHLENDQTIRP
jgi:hypothetical protein